MSSRGAISGGERRRTPCVPASEYRRRPELTTSNSSVCMRYAGLEGRLDARVHIAGARCGDESGESAGDRHAS